MITYTEIFWGVKIIFLCILCFNNLCVLCASVGSVCCICKKH